MEDLHNYYLDKQEPIKSCLLGLQSLLLNYDSDISETFKWGCPCFLYKGKIFCFLSIEKKTKQAYILFEGGKHLAHPSLELKNRKWMKSINIDPEQDFDIDMLHEILEEAIGLHKAGILYVNK
jgi:hypothetical protein